MYPRLFELEDGLAGEERRDIGEAGQRQETVAVEEADHLGEVGLGGFALTQRAERTTPGDGVFAQRGLGLERDEGENAFDFEGRCVHAGQ